MFYGLLGQRHDLLCNHSNTDLLVCEDNMLFSLVKISFFHVKAYLILLLLGFMDFNISQRGTFFIYFHLFNIINKNLNFLFCNVNQNILIFYPSANVYGLTVPLLEGLVCWVQQSSLFLLVLISTPTSPTIKEKHFMVKICFNFICSLNLVNREFRTQFLDSRAQMFEKVILAGDWDNDDFINLLLFSGRWHLFLGTLCKSFNQSMVNVGFVFLFQAIFAYWVTSNLFTVGQVAILSHPAARKAMGIPEMVPYESANSGSFWENLKAGE